MSLRAAIQDYRPLAPSPAGSHEDYSDGEGRYQRIAGALHRQLLDRIDLVCRRIDCVMSCGGWLRS